MLLNPSLDNGGRDIAEAHSEAEQMLELFSRRVHIVHDPGDAAEACGSSHRFRPPLILSGIGRIEYGSVQHLRLVRQQSAVDGDDLHGDEARVPRSEERRVGKEADSTCSSGGSTYYRK